MINQNMGVASHLLSRVYKWKGEHPKKKTSKVEVDEVLVYIVFQVAICGPGDLLFFGGKEQLPQVKKRDY